MSSTRTNPNLPKQDNQPGEKFDLEEFFAWMEAVNADFSDNFFRLEAAFKSDLSVIAEESRLRGFEVLS
jgi:hypothetical protein